MIINGEDGIKLTATVKLINDPKFRYAEFMDDIIKRLSSRKLIISYDYKQIANKANFGTFIIEMEGIVKNFPNESLSEWVEEIDKVISIYKYKSDRPFYFTQEIKVWR